MVKNCHHSVRNGFYGLCLIAAILLNACATTKENRNKVRVNMTKDEIVALLGEPDFTDSNGNCTTLNWNPGSYMTSFSPLPPFCVVLNNDAVTGTSQRCTCNQFVQAPVPLPPPLPIFNSNPTDGMVKAMNPSAPPPQKQIDYTCLNACTSSGMTYGYCQSKCSY